MKRKYKEIYTWTEEELEKEIKNDKSSKKR